MIRLSDALGGWRPAAAGNDPLAAIRAAWSGLVGDEVARNAQPVALQGESVVVITTSSAWSHQLTFLAPEIVRGLRALPSCQGYERLRFRVGRIRVPARGRGPLPVARRRPIPAARPLAAKTAAEALAHLRAAIERTRAAHAAGGGAFCRACAAPIPGGEECEPCRASVRSRLEASAERLIYEAPWLTPSEVTALVPGLDDHGYDTIRRRLLRAWWDELAVARKRARLPQPVAPDRIRLRKIASSYVLLETRIDPNRLDLESPIRRNALGELYDFVREVETAP